MSNHPNRGPQGPSSNPAPDDVRAIRERAGLTQAEAAAIVYSTRNAWQKWEEGSRRMHPALFELFAIKTKG